MADLDAMLREALELSGKLLRDAEKAHAKSVLVVSKAHAPMHTARAMAHGKRDLFHDHPAELAVSIQERSSNRKLAPCDLVHVRDSMGNPRIRPTPTGPYCASTYVSIAATCPTSCTFRDNGCYAQAGASHLTMGALDRAGRRTTGLDVTLAEAAKLDSLWPGGVPQDGHRGGRDLRLHVGGDTSCKTGARALAESVARLQARGLGAAWSYTHAWRTIPRAAFGPISVLASCETPADAVEAMAMGYAPAVTVEEFPSRRAFRYARGLKAIPCPFERGGDTTCVRCRLCFDDKRLRQAGRAIAFATHGADAEQARTRLRVLNGGPR